MFPKIFFLIKVIVCYFTLLSLPTQAYDINQNTIDAIDSNLLIKNNESEVFLPFTAGMSAIYSTFNSYLAYNTQFIQNTKTYEDYIKNFEQILTKQKNDSFKVVEKKYYVNNQLNTYQVKTVSNTEVTLQILKKISGETGPKVAAGMYQTNIQANQILEQLKELESQPENLSKNLEILFQGGQEHKTLSNIVLPENIHGSEINKFLQSFVDQNLITPLQAEGWLKTEILSRLRKFQQEPENFEIGSLIGDRISFNGISTDLYERTGIVTVEQNKKKANVVLFSLISLNEEDPSSIPDPDKGVEKVLAYAKKSPPTSSELNAHRIQSPYSNLIHQANNIVELTEILNQSGHGQGLYLDPTKLKEREWIYGSVDKNSPYYLGKLYGKEPTLEQLKTALHIKEWLRASSIHYLHHQLKIINQQDLANAINTRINNIHPDVANYLAQYLFQKVSNPYCKDNGFCSDLNEIATESSIAVRVISPTIPTIPQTSSSVSLPPEITKPENLYYYPNNEPEFFGGAMAGGGIGGGASGSFLIPLVSGNNGENETPNPVQPTPELSINIVQPTLEIPEPNSSAGLLAVLLLLLTMTKNQQ